MTSSRPDKDTEGTGVSIGLAVAGIVAAGLGLVTMHTAFRPLPKPGVPVVISQTQPPVTQASWTRASNAAPAPADAATEVPAPQPAVRHVQEARAHEVPAPIADTHAAARPQPAAQPAPSAAKASPLKIATADVPGEKLCKAPAPQVLGAKALQPAMILRYDSKFKGPPLDIEPQRPPSDDEQRRLKLSAVLAHILDN